MKKFIPDFYAKSIFDIETSFYIKHNIKCVMSDLDNTLDAHNVLTPSPRVFNLKKDLEDHGIELIIVSNNREKKKRVYCDKLGVKGIFSCRKPSSKKISNFIESLNYKKDEVILIGDQLLTDVLCGKFGKFKVCLTDPISNLDQWTTHFNRLIDKPIRNSLRKKGILKEKEISNE